MGKVFFDFPASPKFIYISKVYYCERYLLLKILFREPTRPEFIGDSFFASAGTEWGGQMRRSRV